MEQIGRVSQWVLWVALLYDVFPSYVSISVSISLTYVIFSSPCVCLFVCSEH